MHKGYAFVQFLNPYDARNACHGEDGRNILSQVLGKYYGEWANGRMTMATTSNAFGQSRLRVRTKCVALFCTDELITCHCSAFRVQM